MTSYRSPHKTIRSARYSLTIEVKNITMSNNVIEYQDKLEEIYTLLESTATNEIIVGLKKLRGEKPDFKTSSFLLGMSWFHPDPLIRRRVKYSLFKDAPEDFASFLKGKWRYTPTPSLSKVWDLMEYLTTHPRIDANLLRRWAYRTYHQTKSLNLENQKLHYLSSELGALKHLKTLNLNRNHLLTLPPELGKLKKLENLYLAHNQIAILPAQIKKLKNLRHLDLTANKGMNNVPSEIAQLQKILILNLSQNNFQALPLSICNLESLKELILAKNQLETLPKECEKLLKLKSLDISYNNFKVLPLKVLSKMESLSTLNIAGNNLSELPLELKQLPRLKQVNVQNIRALASQKSQLQESFTPIELIFEST